MAVHLEPILLPDRAVQIGIHRNPVEIDDRAAGVANKVTVRGGNGVKPFLSMDDAYALNGPLPLEKKQVPVHRAQT